MPEGPEILFFSIFLKQKFIGGIVKYLKSHPDNDLNIPEDLNGEIVDVSSKGKVLWFKMKSVELNKYYYMHIHLGISGWIMFKEAKYIKYSFTITKSDKKQNIFIEDKTRLSNISIYNEEEHDKIINKLGIDIFTSDFTFNKFKSVVKSKNMILASFLLKQELFSGIGNYIKNEVLYLGNLDVTCKTSSLTDIQINDLYKNILFVAYSHLIEQLKNSGLEKYLPEGNKINMPVVLEIPYKYKIYRRTFTDDGKRVKNIKVGGRDTYCIDE